MSEEGELDWLLRCAGCAAALTCLFVGDRGDRGSGEGQVFRGGVFVDFLARSKGLLDRSPQCGGTIDQCLRHMNSSGGTSVGQC